MPSKKKAAASVTRPSNYLLRFLVASHVLCSSFVNIVPNKFSYIIIKLSHYFPHSLRFKNTVSKLSPSLLKTCFLQSDRSVTMTPLFWVCFFGYTKLTKVASTNLILTKLLSLDCENYKQSFVTRYF